MGHRPRLLGLAATYCLHTWVGLTFLRGEIHISSHGAANYVKKVKPEIEKGKVLDIMTLGIIGSDGKVTKNPLAPNAPTFPEMYEKVNGKALAGDDLEAFYSIAAAWSMLLR